MSERRTLVLAAALVGASVPGFLTVFALWASRGLSEADALDPARVQAFAGEHPALYGALPGIGVVMHLAALLLVIGLHRRLVDRSPLWVSAGSVLGLSWVAVDLVQNLMHWGTFLGATPPELVAATNRAADAVWHAGHLGGGVWVMVVAVFGRPLFGRVYAAYSLVAGAFFALHPFAFPLAPWWFGVELLLVPVWAFWTAVAIARSPAFSPDGHEPAGAALPRAPGAAVGPA